MESIQNSEMHSTITTLKALIDADQEKQLENVKPMYETFKQHEGFCKKFPTLEEYALHWKEVRSKCLERITSPSYTCPDRHISSLAAYQMDLSVGAKEVKVRKDYLMFLETIAITVVTYNVNNFLVPRILKLT